MVIDNDLKGSASQVAAGIINPITGHRLNLTTDFVDDYAHATQFYASLEQQFNVNLIDTVNQVRLIKNPGQAGYFARRLKQKEYQEFLAVNSDTSLFGDTEHGTARIQQTSVVDTKQLLREIKKWLILRDSYINAPADYTSLQFTTGMVKYQALNAQGIIFCEGYQAINNPWLKDLPFKLAKGEVLTIERLRNTDTMLSWGNWLIPHNDNSAKLGSNYAWHDTELVPSKDVRDKLLDSLEAHTGLRPAVLNHEVGIRPTTTDRHAFVGPISGLDNGYCFNGFGSKGCLTISTHADLLCEYLLNQAPLPEALSKWL